MKKGTSKHNFTSAFDKLSKDSLKVVELDKLRGAKGTCHDEDDKILRDAGWFDQFD